MSVAPDQEELSYDEAIEVLGFEPDAIVSPHLPAFRKVEGKLKDLIATTSDDAVKAKYRKELDRLHEALRIVESGGEREPPARRKGAGLRLLVSLLLVACVIGVAWVGNLLVLEERAKNLGRSLEQLAVDGRIAVENRRWDEAEAIYRKMLEQQPGSPRAQAGLEGIEEGKQAERRQQLAFLQGTAQAAIDEQDWERAEISCRELLALEPNHADAQALLKRIEEGRTTVRIAGILEQADEALREEEWQGLITKTNELAEIAPEHPELGRLRTAAKQGMRMLEQRSQQARALYERALAADDGTYQPEALDALREALRLASDPEIQALYQKMSAYARVLSVPGEFESISAALAAARPKDKVLVGEGTFEEGLVFPVEIDLEGAGIGKTIIVTPAANGSALVAGENAGQSRVASLTLRQSGTSLTDERFPVVAIDGGGLAIEDCHIEGGAGHGVAVVHGGSAKLNNVRVSSCGWDGLSVYGEGSSAEVMDSRFEENLHHGIDVWDGGRLDVRKSRCTLNGLTGIVIMSPEVDSLVQQCVVDRNREVGIAVSKGARVTLRSNRATSNLLGGFSVEGEGTEVIMEGNIAEKNQRAGIVVDRRSTVKSYEKNTAKGNEGAQEQLKADLPDPVVPNDPIPPAFEAPPPKAIPVPED